MCYFITIGLPGDKAEFLEKRIPRGLHIRRIVHHAALQQMGHGFRTYLLMSGGCSCALFNERTNDSHEDRQAKGRSEQERLRRKYEKLGWSSAKIDRALGQHAGSPGAQSVAGLRGDVQRFLGELATIAGELAVLVHWYDEDVRDGDSACKKGEVVSPDAALEGRLHINSDEIVWISARRR